MESPRCPVCTRIVRPIGLLYRHCVTCDHVPWLSHRGATRFIGLQLFHDPLPTAEVTSRENGCEPLVEMHGNKCRGLFHCELPETTNLSSSRYSVFPQDPLTL
jgi:hypothetical protein